MSNDAQSNADNDLIRIHRVVTRALQVARKYSQGNNLADGQRPGFEMYVRSLHTLLESHHAGEDELAFPFWRIRMPDGPFDKLSEQHVQMAAFLVKIHSWLENVPTAWEPDYLQKLHTSLGDLESLWLTHISIEEPTIGPENSIKYLTPVEREQITIQLAEHGQAHALPSEQMLPFLIYNLYRRDRDEFSKSLPAVIVQQLIPFAWKAAWEPMKPFLLVD